VAAIPSGCRSNDGDAAELIGDIAHRRPLVRLPKAPGVAPTGPAATVGLDGQLGTESGQRDGTPGTGHRSFQDRAKTSVSAGE
jgi:hypothetical protein